VDNIKLLDCTLRDGAHVNDGNFGFDVIKGIVKELTYANVDIVELGFLKNGKFTKRQSFYNYIEEIYSILESSLGTNKYERFCEYSVMIRSDLYDIKKLTKCNGLIKNIRFAFYYKDTDLLKEQCYYAREKGYNVIINPINFTGYNADELSSLLKVVNNIMPSTLTIVDTFGSITKEILLSLYTYLENNLNKNISIGLHLHENLSLSFSLAQYFVEIKEKSRPAVIDATLFGMGRIPGNLSIELIADYMNSNLNKAYKMENILEAISKYIAPIKTYFAWGYSPAYFLTAKTGTHRSYAEFLLKKNDLTLNDINKIIGIVCKSKQKSIFDGKYIEKIYLEYKNNI
jgi:4-hydroxy 2-oxovalerate aldolase